MPRILRGIYIFGIRTSKNKVQGSYGGYDGGSMFFCPFAGTDFGWVGHQRDEHLNLLCPLVERAL